MGSTYKIISIICFALAGLMLTVGIILFFTLKIRVVIGYLTGKTEKKSIAMMQNSNKNTEMRFSYAEQVKRDGIRNITSEITDGLSSGTVSLNESKVTEVLSSVDTDSGTTILYKSEIGIEKITLFKDVLIIHTDKEIV